MRSLIILRETNCPVIFDASHSVQQPGIDGSQSGGESKFISTLAKAAVAVGIDGLFIETHPEPNKALSDGKNSLPLDDLEKLITKLVEINKISKSA